MTTFEPDGNGRESPFRSDPAENEGEKSKFLDANSGMNSQPAKSSPIRRMEIRCWYLGLDLDEADIVELWTGNQQATGILTANPVILNATVLYATSLGEGSNISIVDRLASFSCEAKAFLGKRKDRAAAPVWNWRRVTESNDDRLELVDKANPCDQSTAKPKIFNQEVTIDAIRRRDDRPWNMDLLYRTRQSSLWVNILDPTWSRPLGIIRFCCQYIYGVLREKRQFSSIKNRVRTSLDSNYSIMTTYLDCLWNQPVVCRKVTMAVRWRTFQDRNDLIVLETAYMYSCGNIWHGVWWREYKSYFVSSPRESAIKSVTREKKMSDVDGFTSDWRVFY